MTASRQDVLGAYQKLRALYSDPAGNASAYFSEDELKELREVLEEGFELLSHPLKRAAYNESLKKIYPEKYSRDHRRPIPNLPISSVASTQKDFDGFFLRQIREQMSVSIDELSDVTRIKPNYLVALENNDYESLPATVFVRGFVSQVAKVYGLDEKKICDGYMSRLKEARHR